MNKKKIYILFFYFMSNLSAFNVLEKQPLVMIDPAGHAKNVGRRLIESYERGETFKFAERLKDALSEKYGIRSVLTRFPGEEIIDLQNASFANRLQVDFYISLHIYRQDNVKPKIYIYYLVYDPVVDLTKRTIDPLKFLPIQQAHFPGIGNTLFSCKKIKECFSQMDNQKKFDFYGPYGIPFKPLVGVTAPAIGLEVGIDQEDKWLNLVEPIVESLSFLCDNDGSC
ncbi:MAG: hypothetical protein ABIA74_01395 [bacterium]